MRLRLLVFPVVLLPMLLAGARDSSAMGGIEGTFEYAIDAPWRIEPVVDGSGHASYGAIPIQLTVHDENVIPFDAFTKKYVGASPVMVPSGRMLGNFCDLEVKQGNTTRHIALRDMAEIEMTGNASTTWQNGSWIHGSGPPPHMTCTPGPGQPCTALQSPHGTSEWHATAWYSPMAGTFNPGSDIMLTLTAKFTRTFQVACTSTKDSDFVHLKNYVSVHAGEAPLPRFHDNRWAYGDLHFHGQGTDNEGESGYNYRGIIRAMGALGLDFVLASEHASDSVQILDIDYNGPVGAVFEGHLVSRTGSILRDMDAQRFSFLLNQLWGEGGVNKIAAIDGRTAENQPSRPQTVLGHGAAPQIFLGGEVDAIPELDANFSPYSSYQFASSRYFLNHLCDGWQGPETRCPQDKTVQQDLGVSILKDVQGYDSIHPARVHMVYMPRDPQNTNGFVASRTGVFGGGGRHLTRGDGVFPEMENNGGPQKGYTFLAHPVPGGDCNGGVSTMTGGPGPDVIPYSPMMLDQAFRSKAVLGLELWNEDARMKNAAGKGTTKEMGFESSTGAGGHGMRNDEPKGWVTGKFEMYPWVRFPEPSYDQTCQSQEWMLHNGLKEVDDLNMKGLVPSETAALSWLPSGEPRRVFIAGGSDAHGDLNYHRSGYMLGLETIDDMGIGKPRNLVFAGAPDVTLVGGGGPSKIAARILPGGGGGITPADFGVHAHSHGQVLNALIAGAFSVTDGPALRIAIDKNGNGAIDDADFQMGSVVEMYGDTILPVIIEWDSTPEWGWVEQVDLVIGAINSADPDPKDRALFAPPNNGPRTSSIPQGPLVSSRATGNNRNVLVYQDGYTGDPMGGSMRFNPVSFSGKRKFDIPIASLAVGMTKTGAPINPDRLFIRAFARSQPRDGAKCIPDPKGGQCIWRYAFANPVWAITPPRPAGTCPTNKPRAIDSDGDGLPDGCDPCPRGRGLVCPNVVPPNGGGLNRN